MTKINLATLPDPGERYVIENCLGCGVFGKVYKSIDSEASNKKVAIKMQELNEETRKFIEEEHQILHEFTSHPNLIDFYGVYKKSREIWFILEICEGGPVSDLVLGLLNKNRRMAEEHIAYILKETIQGLIYLHESRVIHRDIKATNILLTREGEVKLADFGLARRILVQNAKEKVDDCLGSAAWMAPEVAAKENYDNRADVWALGITAIELGDGKSPYQDMHPSRALFQIGRNPPPTLYRVSNWSENYNDFISECLVKNYEYRPYIMEVIQHPFLEQIPENNYHLSLEIKSLLNDLNKPDPDQRTPEIIVNGDYVKKDINGAMEKMLIEDLAALSPITEEKLLETLQNRLKVGEFQTFIGDILLVLNPNEKQNIYNGDFHQKYELKSRSDNAPHIYAIADTAYQHAIHHVVPQRIVLSGESGAGKTSNYLHLIDHLTYLGRNANISASRIKNAVKLMHALTHAATRYNDYSTRCIIKTTINYGKTGKLSGASFGAHFLEKWRVSTVDMHQGNFHFFYYVYDGLTAAGQLDKYQLNADRNYRYLRVASTNFTVTNNASKYEKLLKYMQEYQLAEHEIQTVIEIVAAILNLGEIRLQETDDLLEVYLENEDALYNFCSLLGVDEKKMKWALTNFCVTKEGTAYKRTKSCDEARDSRDVLANTLYSRMVDYVLSLINCKLAFGTTIFGQKYSVNILDYFGFECFRKNHLPQFYVNCFNEQMQYHYLQRIFSWEILDMNSEDVEYKSFTYYDNKIVLDALLGKVDGVLSSIDDASKQSFSGKYILEQIQNQDCKHVTVINSNEFTIAHYIGKVAYNVREMPNKNGDYLSPEIYETLRASTNPIIHQLFAGALNKTGNLLVNFTDEEKHTKKFSFSNAKRVAMENQYSQTRKRRTTASIYRAISLDLLKELSIGGASGGTHFVRCIKANLEAQPLKFCKELVKQQVRALAVCETAKARQNGYPYRIAFAEFLRRYKFLAFDFDENVDITSDNCRLLLVRLKMEGWCIGKTKVFLKYYNEEYLARLYESQVKKIIKIQSILRTFLVKCRANKQIKETESECIEKIKRSGSIMTPDEAAEIIQKAYRKATLKKANANFMSEYEMLSEEDFDFIKPFAKRWRNNSIFHVLLQYRAHKQHEFFNFAQQVHLYGLAAFHHAYQTNETVDVESIDTKAQALTWLGKDKPAVLKVPFRLDEIPFYDSSTKCPTPTSTCLEKEEAWDTPYRWREARAASIKAIPVTSSPALEVVNFNRDPDEPIKDLPPIKEGPIVKKTVIKENKIVPVQETCNIYSTSNLKKVEPLKKPDKKAEENNFITNTRPANKDFDYIKTSPITNKPKRVDPVAELRTMGRRSSGNEDDPPFNFQGMLRKTNFQKDVKEEKVQTPSPAKRAMSAVRKFSLTRKMSEGLMTNGEIAGKKTSLEFGPGLIMQGVEVEV